MRLLLYFTFSCCFQEMAHRYLYGHRPFMKYCSILLLLLVETCPLRAQSPTGSLARSVDSLFAGWNGSTTPGCAVGIVQNGSLVYQRGYGMANLEYGVPNTPLTIFDVGSVSKQFTAYCIVLLALQHRLGLEDDIHRYIGWLAVGEKITVLQLLNHTSGIRDYFQLLAIAGKNADDAFTQQQAIHILSRQRTLNNRPGERFVYSNSNYLLLAEIIKKVSGRTLRQFADSAIFGPLKMTGSYFSDDYTEIQKGRAYSYNKKDSAHFGKAFATDSDIGPGNLFCNVGDMAKWVVNFFDTSKGNRAAIKLLTQKGKLDDGTGISYASGINVGDHRGWAMYEHEGESAGFNSCVSIFPELGAGVIVFANVGSESAVGKNLAVADLFLQDREARPGAVPVDSNGSVITNMLSMEKRTGRYTADDGAMFDLVLGNKRLFVVRNNDSGILAKGSGDTLVQASRPDRKFVFHTTPSGARVADESWPGRSRRSYLWDRDTLFPNEKSRGYAGTYLCAELGCTYTISIHGNQLVLNSNLYDGSPIWSDGNDDLFTGYGWMSHLQITRNRKRQVTGFRVNSGRVLHLVFTKIR